MEHPTATLQAEALAPVDTTSGVPIYRQIAEQLAAHLESLPAGTRLPSETAIARRAGVSRGTAVQALRELEHRDLVVRVQGSGTFKASPSPGSFTRSLDAGKLPSFSGDLERAGHATRERIERCESGAADHETAAALGIEPGAAIWSIERTVLADERAGRPHRLRAAGRPLPGDRRRGDRRQLALRLPRSALRHRGPPDLGRRGVQRAERDRRAGDRAARAGRPRAAALATRRLPRRRPGGRAGALVHARRRLPRARDAAARRRRRRPGARRRAARGPAGRDMTAAQPQASSLGRSIDVGSSSVKALVLAGDGSVVECVSAAHALVPTPGAVEADAQGWWEASLAALKQLTHPAGRDRRRRPLGQHEQRRAARRGARAAAPRAAAGRPARRAPSWPRSTRRCATTSPRSRVTRSRPSPRSPRCCGCATTTPRPSPARARGCTRRTSSGCG